MIGVTSASSTSACPAEPLRPRDRARAPVAHRSFVRRMFKNHPPG